MADENVHWSDHIGNYGKQPGMMIVFFIYRFLGRRFTNFILWFVALYYVVFHKKVRQSSLLYLKHMKKQGGKVRANFWGCVRHVHAFAKMACDKLTVYQGLPLGLPLRYEAQGRQQVKENLEKKQGVMLITTHFGNSDLIRYLVKERYNVRVTVLVHTLEDQPYQALFKELEAQGQMSLVEVSNMGPDTAILLKNRIENGEWVVIVGDRIPLESKGHTQTAFFLGEKAHFSEGPWLLASILGCPVFTVLTFYKQGGYEIQVKKLTQRITLSRGQRHTGLQPFITQFAQILEKACFAAPYQWFNFYNFWSVPPSVPPQARASSKKGDTPPLSTALQEGTQAPRATKQETPLQGPPKS